MSDEKLRFWRTFTPTMTSDVVELSCYELKDLLDRLEAAERICGYAISQDEVSRTFCNDTRKGESMKNVEVTEQQMRLLIDAVSERVDGMEEDRIDPRIEPYYQQLVALVKLLESV